MIIIFKDQKFKKECNDSRLLRKAHGEKRATKIRRRLDELLAADFLSDISHLPPPRLHQLVGDRAGQISVDLDHPYRLIFVVANNPEPKKEDGSLDMTNVTAIMIIGVEDTHE